ncbi:glycosyltransferase [Streptococcus ovuberis]|uniref:Glycosyltransferase n=1 Tax=Streptococcus ovuberis TaxID=1936207 RepID=A0A7X6MZ80_9STRE|nr:glycosyltransferase [Streptococcus ovuberis]NKZ20586.1 glycosyltransferase [Streptococcus ovuberis]
MMIIIPSYEPDEKLVKLVIALKTNPAHQILVVDDGSGPRYANLFATVAELGATVLTHEVNRGKGAALKTAFAYLKERANSDDVFVTADSDGQHLVEDIDRVGQAVKRSPHQIVLGARAFVGKVPARSRFGNKVTAGLFKLVTGQAISDTQTGLRGFSSQHLDWLLSLPGERFEYEFQMLLDSKKAGFTLVEVPIETIYIEENKSSHFRPIQDSVRIYAPFLTFMASSCAAALLDIGLLFLLMTLTNNLLVSVILSRLASAGFQYLLNAHLVFRQKEQNLTPIMRYGLLVVALLVCNAFMLQGLVKLGIGLLLAKIMTEIFLFLVSYRMQQTVVFG